VREMRMHINFWLENLKRDHSEGLGVDESVNFRMNLRKIG
jgi:hypothetical protein